MNCSICGRRLRSPKSLELGYGPVCYRKYSRENIGDIPYYEIPGQINMDDYLRELNKERLIEEEIQCSKQNQKK